MWSQLDIAFKKLINRVVTDSDGKVYYEEFGDKTINVAKSDIWDVTPDSDPSQAVLDGAAQLYTLYTLTEDVTVPNQQAYYAGPAIDSRLKDWISPKYGSDYQIQLYDNNDVLIDQTNAVDWYFDYVTGILSFNGDTSTFAKPFKITGYRYIGLLGVSAPTNVYLEQAFTSQTSVLINHGWNTRPVVSIIDGTNNIIVGDVTYDDLDNVTVTFSLPQTGTVILQSGAGVPNPYLPLTGGTMSGNIDMNSNSILSGSVLMNFSGYSFELTTNNGVYDQAWLYMSYTGSTLGYGTNYIEAGATGNIQLVSILGPASSVDIRTGVSNWYAKLKDTNLTANRTFEFPDATGTLALTSDITVLSASNGLNLSGSDVQLGGILTADTYIDGNNAYNLFFGANTPFIGISFYTPNFTIQDTANGGVIDINGTRMLIDSGSIPLEINTSNASDISTAAANFTTLQAFTIKRSNLWVEYGNQFVITSDAGVYTSGGRMTIGGTNSEIYFDGNYINISYNPGIEIGATESNSSISLIASDTTDGSVNIQAYGGMSLETSGTGNLAWLFADNLSANRTLQLADHDGIIQSSVTINIGDWDMTTLTTTVAHGLANHKLIKGVSVIVRDDNDVNYYDFERNGDGYIDYFDSTNIVLQVKSVGAFDTTDFDTASSYNRGTITFYFN